MTRSLKSRVAAPIVLALAVFVGFFASFASRAPAQAGGSAVLQQFSGTYRNPMSDGGRARILEAIEGVVSRMAPVRGNIARRRLVASDPPIPRITITPTGDGLVVDYTRGRRNETQHLGTFAPNPAAGGGQIDVKHEVVGRRLRETYRESRGGAVHLFSLSSSGDELTLEATIRSPYLPDPITYSLTFERAR